MFIKRLIMTCILIPLVVLLVLGASSAVFQIISAILCLYAAWEWAILAGVQTTYHKFVYVVFMLAILSVVQFVPFIYILWIGFFWWIAAIVILWRYVTKEPTQTTVLMTLLMGFACIIPCWVGLNSLRGGPHGSGFLLLFLFLLWATDSGAYAAGMKWGKHKLLPKVSPGKTIEGVLGGLASMLVVLIVGMLILRLPATQWLPLAAIAMVTSIFSIIGDLFESMLKRKAGVKDSGGIIPGHGGILDRLDSAFAAAPIFALAVLLFNIV
jgi:phosphatidate cytidylyltransferase